MKITVTDVSKSLLELVSTAYSPAIAERVNVGDFSQNSGRISVVLRNGATNPIYLTNTLSTATIADALQIKADEAFSFETKDIGDVKFVSDAGISQTVFVEFF